MQRRHVDRRRLRIDTAAVISLGSECTAPNIVPYIACIRPHARDR
jgi:hypothetical protein